MIKVKRDKDGKVFTTDMSQDEGIYEMQGTVSQFATSKECIAYNRALQRVVMCGDLLQGGAIISGRGVEEWTDYPRYRVVAIHMNRVTMFLETLNSKGEIVGCEKMDFTSDQWRHWDT